ncbi:hypothetical protein [Bacillus mobilis]|uniref:hypothetical protein n=1 Tax=Bacillus mobilis TaxID=2026190 RepID=UPI003CF437C5
MALVLTYMFSLLLAVISLVIDKEEDFLFIEKQMKEQSGASVSSSSLFIERRNQLV